MTQKKTYWHLEQHKRIPSQYEIATSNLHYYMTHAGFEVNVPLSEWYRQYQQNCPVKCADWELFTDPRQTTYSKYTIIQQEQETFVDGLLQLIEDRDYDRQMPPECIAFWAQIFAPLRYPLHGFQMVAAYIGQMAPSGRITVAALFQSADEVRRIQRIAYRMRQLQIVDPGFGQDSQCLWETAAHFQPLRRAVERLLVTYDWFEAFVALNLVLKPVIDQLLMVHFGELVSSKGDHITDEIFSSFNHDCNWHRDWSSALTRIVIADPANRAVVVSWIDKWYDLVMQAVIALQSPYDQDRDNNAFAAVLDRLTAFYESFLVSAQLECPDSMLMSKQADGH